MLKYGRYQWILQDMKKNVYYLHYEDIVYLETCSRYVQVITHNETIQTSLSLGQIQNELPENFLRIHRSIMINLEYIFKISRYEIKMRNGIVFPVPEKKYGLVRNEINTYINKKNLQL